MKALKFRPYTTKEIKPTGWLKRQLHIQAESLSGNLHKIWPDVRDSKWIGGNKDGWERVPYWLDGFIPLAYLLEREDLQQVAKKYIDAIIEQQDEDGWICPCTKEERGKYDTWATFLISKVMVNYYECSGDDRIPGVVEKALKNLNDHITHYPVMDSWGKTRWYETLIAIYWLRERKEEDWQLELAHKLAGQSYDFKTWMNKWKYKNFVKGSPFLHVVNVAMSLKGPSLYSRITDQDYSSYSYEMMDILDAYHGMPTGQFAGDEHLGGTSPIRGAECCSVVEFMYSLQHLISLTGDVKWSDRLERVAFNALPATLSPDMWTHQYDQLTNQVQCTRFEEGKQVFTTNPVDSHLFGLEPNFGCCTANFNQGFPKLALSAFMSYEEGIAATTLLPAKVETTIKGVSVTIESITDYPFKDQVTYKIRTQEAVELEFAIKVPSYATTATINDVPVKTGEFHRIKQVFEGETEVIMTIEQETKVVKRPSGMVAIQRGALTFAVPVEEEWVKFEYEKDGVVRQFPYCDYELLPKSKWNYCLTSRDFQVNYHQISDYPFDNKAPAITLNAKLREIEWDFKDGAPTAVPGSIIFKGSEEQVALNPFGATNLRLTEMPLVLEDY